MGAADIQGLVSSAEHAHRLPTRHAHISEAIAALVRIDDNLASPEDLQAVLAEVGRIASGLDSGELLGAARVVELIDQAHDACDDIRESTATCGLCQGSGDGRYAGLCHACGGKGEAQQ